jgi:hypothetical protein
VNKRLQTLDQSKYLKLSPKKEIPHNQLEN